MSRASKIGVALAAFVLTTAPGLARAQEQFVYLVNADNKAALTGFRVKGTPGIITALHGVVGAKTITASSAKGPILREPLKIVKVDVRKDLALLVSSETERYNDEGFEVAKIVDWEILGKVRIIGYPDEIDLQDISRTLEVGKPPLSKLELLIGPENRLRLRTRNSPDPTQEVLSLQGPLLPGHSGAPVVDSQRNVIAVGNGGLRNGQIGIGWAIPFPGVQWKSAENSPELDSLVKLDSRLLFDFNPDPKTIEKKIEALSNELGPKLEEIRNQLMKKNKDKVQILDSEIAYRLAHFSAAIRYGEEHEWKLSMTYANVLWFLDNPSDLYPEFKVYRFKALLAELKDSLSGEDKTTVQNVLLTAIELEHHREALKLRDPNQAEKPPPELKNLKKNILPGLLKTRWTLMPEYKASDHYP